MARLREAIHYRAAVAVTIAMLVATPALPAPDSGQEAVLAQLREGRKELHQIEHIPVAERGPALHEHMTLVGHALASARALQPRRGMPLKERLAWQAEQQKLFEAMVEQMLDNHHLLLEMVEK
jgi:hypothetical protein